MVERLSFGDPPRAQQQLDVAVVAGALRDAARTKQVDATVANVRPEGARALHQAHGAGGTRPRLRWQPPAERNHGLVRAAHGEVQKSVGIEQRAARPAEFGQHRADGRLRGTRALGVPAHAVHHGDERRVVVGGDHHPVLVFFAIPEEAQLRVLDLQGTLRHACSHVNSIAFYSTRAGAA